MEEQIYGPLASLRTPMNMDTQLPWVPWSGTRALMLAVLEDAIHCLGSAGRLKRAEAEGWIMSREHRYVFSFAMICETFDLSPSAVRHSLRRLLSQKPRGCRPPRRARANVRTMEIAQRAAA